MAWLAGNAGAADDTTRAPLKSAHPRC